MNDEKILYIFCVANNTVFGVQQPSQHFKIPSAYIKYVVNLLLARKFLFILKWREFAT